MRKELLNKTEEIREVLDLNGFKLDTKDEKELAEYEARIRCNTELTIDELVEMIHFIDNLLEYVYEEIDRINLENFDDEECICENCIDNAIEFASQNSEGFIAFLCKKIQKLELDNSILSEEVELLNNELEDFR